MKKKMYTLIAAVIVVFVVAGAVIFRPPSGPVNQLYFGGFEDGFDGWSAGADVPEDPK